jgi:hypothetical protein
MAAVDSRRWDIFYKFSTYRKLVRVISFIRRFLNNCGNKNNKISGPLSVSEMEEANLTLIKRVQLESFSEDVKRLSNQKEIKKDSKLKDLNPFLDAGIVRVGGRLKMAECARESKHPILLPAKHVFTELLVKNFHHQNLHCGPQTLLGIVRLKYWPIAGRTVIQKIFQNCTLCFRFKPKFYPQKMSDLPRTRLEAIRPFHNTIVDYAGPFLIKSSYTRNSGKIKSYLVLFICMSTRAAHLDLVTSLTTEAFLNVFKRFYSRRGIPQKMISDGGGCFVGAARELKALYDFLGGPGKDPITNGLAEHGIEWVFAVPRAPHTSGAVETMVRQAKILLRKTIASTPLTYEDLSTVICQAESVLNSRPLFCVPLSSSPLDAEHITPSHFLISQSTAAIPTSSNSLTLPTNQLNHYRKLMNLFLSFWERFNKEYLQQLQKRAKWRERGKVTICVGDIVLVKEDNLPPCQWRLGRVMETFPGPDGITRTVMLRTSLGNLKRNIMSIAPLPLCRDTPLRKEEEEEEK